MELFEKRILFTNNVCKLIAFITAHSIGVSFGETYRTYEQAKLYFEQGIGAIDSQHCKGLAVDLNLYRGNEYLKDAKDYICAGKYWELLHHDNRWGGNWDKDDTILEEGEFDACHFEMMG